MGETRNYLEKAQGCKVLAASVTYRHGAGHWHALHVADAVVALAACSFVILFFG